MNMDRIDVLILTFNEEANIARTLDALVAFPSVVILDSGSTDATLAIAARYPNVRVCTRRFDTHAAQWNHGIHACGLEAEWVLALDADYVLPPALVREIRGLEPTPVVWGYRARFKYCIEGRPLTGSLYPPVTILYRREGAIYEQDGHTQRVRAGGQVNALATPVLHDDRKPLGRWLTAQDRYAQLEADAIFQAEWKQLRAADRLRRMIVITPWLVPLYCLVVGKGFLDGRAGLLYAIQRGVAESILALKLLERHIRSGAE
jgi:glycosyltransferase involved in cell wall biosynthesis